MLATERCKYSIKFAKDINRDIKLVVRPWIDLSKGVEFRCFIYEDKIRAISINDDKICDLDDNEIITRAQKLFKKIQYNIPCDDCIMDIWVDNNFDLVIEFNSYGFWGIAGINAFDWIEDAALLYGLINCDVEVRRV